MRQSTTLIGAMLLRRGDGDALLCGTYGRHKDHLRHINNVIGLEKGAGIYAAMNVLLLPKQTLFVCDTYVNEDPTAEQLAEIAVMAARGGAALRHHAQGGAAVAFQLRHRRLALGR